MALNEKLIPHLSYIWKILGKKRLLQFSGLLLLMILSVFVEMISLGAIVPFLSALTDPQSLMELDYLKPVLDYLKITTHDQLLLWITLLFIAAAVLASIIRISLLLVNTKLSASMAIQLRTEIYRRTLYRPYAFHINHNSSDLISILVEKVNVVINAGILHVLLLITATLTSLSIIATILIIDPVVALLSFLILGGGYLLIGFYSRKKLKINSKMMSTYQPIAIKHIQEGIGGIRDVILDHSQENYLKNYNSAVKKVQYAMSSNAIISQLPKTVLELIGIVLIAGLAYYLTTSGGGALPVLGALALGSQRLLPALQQIYYSWSTISGNQKSIMDTASYLALAQTIAPKDKTLPPIEFNEMVELKEIQFQYTNAEKMALQEISLSIQKGSTVGFIGETGSGKSTLLDIIMGLLTPSHGELTIDHVVIDNHNRHKWQEHIAHVPQNIYLSDATIMENIAFGVPLDEINQEKVKEAAQRAHLDHFIETLPDRYHTEVGERGIQLSGGQRQRIGIARALYRDAALIVFDEATSALDDQTETMVMEAINSLDKELTILIIAHRVTTLKNCDIIYKLSNSTVVDSGTYETLCLNSSEVRHP